MIENLILVTVSGLSGLIIGVIITKKKYRIDVRIKRKLSEIKNIVDEMYELDRAIGRVYNYVYLDFEKPQKSDFGYVVRCSRAIQDLREELK